MSKIEFEDRTVPKEKTDAEIEHLANSFFTGAVKVGTLAGYLPNEIIKAFWVAAKDLCNYSLEMGVAKEEDIKNIQDDAERIAQERAKAFKESEVVDIIKRFTEEIKGKAK